MQKCEHDLPRLSQAYNHTLNQALRSVRNRMNTFYNLNLIMSLKQRNILHQLLCKLRD